jgi:signal transduction histidine kinase
MLKLSRSYFVAVFLLIALICVSLLSFIYQKKIYHDRIHNTYVGIIKNLNKKISSSILENDKMYLREFSGIFNKEETILVEILNKNSISIFRNPEIFSEEINKPYISLSVYRLGTLVGKINIFVDEFELNKKVLMSTEYLFNTLIFALTVFLILYFYLTSQRKMLNDYIGNLTGSADEELKIKLMEIMRKNRASNVNAILKLVNEVMVEGYRRNAHKKAMEEKYDIMSSVVHDIQSPIIALEAILASDKIDKEMLILVLERIKDITNTLDKEKERALAIGRYSINEIMVEISKEKSLESINKHTEVNIQVINKNDFVAEIDRNRFKRVVSNLINNSIDAQACNVTIIIDENQVVFRDNGKGIEKEVLNNLLNISDSGKTFGKDSGQGIGFLSFKKFVDEYHLVYEITSKVGFGTEILLKF